MARCRVELGFPGGTALRLTVADEETANRIAEGILTGEGGWRSVGAEEGLIHFKQDDVLYAGLSSLSDSVGFGGA